MWYMDTLIFSPTFALTLVPFGLNMHQHIYTHDTPAMAEHMKWHEKSLGYRNNIMNNVFYVIFLFAVIVIVALLIRSAQKTHPLECDYLFRIGSVRFGLEHT